MQFSLRGCLVSAIVVAACLSGGGTAVLAVDILVSWGANTEPDLKGYKVYYGTASRIYGTPVDVGKTTNHLIPGLSNGIHYFAVTAYDTSGNESSYSEEEVTTISSGGTPTPGQMPTTVTFDNPVPSGNMDSLLNGVFQGIDFGSGEWRWSLPTNVNPTNSVFFASSTGTFRTFTFSPAPKILNSLVVYAVTAGTLTLSDNLGQTKSQNIFTGTLQPVVTGWTQASVTVTVSFTNGWDLGIDAITYSNENGTTGGSLSETIWRSYDVVTQSGSPQAAMKDSLGLKTATLEFYESVNNGGVDKGGLLSIFVPGVHIDSFNHLEKFWTVSTTDPYPYAGKSNVNRGSDTGETNTPAPAGVRDLQLHPPENGHLVVAAFKVPEAGAYSVYNLAARRPSSSGTTVRYKVFNAQKSLIANLQATNSRSWVTDPQTYNLGNLAVGDTLYFAVDRDGTYAWDATEIAWTIKRTGQSQTTTLTFQSIPSGLQLLIDGIAQTTPFSRQVIVNGVSTISATSPQTVGNTQYSFSSWSDGGAQTHLITASTSPQTYTATFSTAAGSLPETIWRSYDVVTQSGSPQATMKDSLGLKTATLEFYESVNNGGVDKGGLLSIFVPGVHNESFNHLEKFWTVSTTDPYPYAGKSNVNRGSDTGETNTPAPAGVRDLQLHPPENGHLVVAAFKVPEAGAYSVYNLAARRPSSSGTTVRYKVFNAQKNLIANLQATNSRSWVTDPQTYNLGNLAVGDTLYFAVDRDGTYAWDATEIAWTIKRTGP